jgi:hypothetical protein
MLVNGYTLESGRCESASIARHLGVKEVLVDEAELASILDADTPEPAVIIASKLNRYASIVEAGRRNVILVHLSDEAYDVSHARLYLDKKVKLVARNYKVFPFGFLLLAAIKWPFLAARWMGAYWRPRAPWRDNWRHAKRVFLSRRYLLRQIRFAYLIRRMSGTVVDFPLNETDGCSAISTPGIPDKRLNVSFAGGVHSSERVFASDVAAALGVSHGYAGWGLHSASALSTEEYFQLLLSSKFVLAPTGHVNLECFRFYEALSAGALPVVPSSTPYQPRGYFAHLYDIDRRLLLSTFSIKHVNSAIGSISDEERPLLVQRIQRTIAAHNAAAKRAIEDCLKSSR